MKNLIVFLALTIAFLLNSREIFAQTVEKSNEEVLSYSITYHAPLPLMQFTTEIKFNRNFSESEIKRIEEVLESILKENFIVSSKGTISYKAKYLYYDQPTIDNLSWMLNLGMEIKIIGKIKNIIAPDKDLKFLSRTVVFTSKPINSNRRRPVKINPLPRPPGDDRYIGMPGKTVPTRPRAPGRVSPF